MIDIRRRRMKPVRRANFRAAMTPAIMKANMINPLEIWKRDDPMWEDAPTSRQGRDC